MIIKLDKNYDYFIFEDKTNLNSGDIVLTGKSEELFYLIESSLLRQKNVFVVKQDAIKIDLALTAKKRVHVDNNGYVFLSPRARFFFKNAEITKNDCESFEALSKKVSTLK